eukprot:TRINITY_DN164_c0_g1_i1.p1 TRINITY_DN164_c0_g1~~TRINITY_DN164_c0_g1_i1.p1  ORF type:complete len:424 (+),score=74.67 TRINITY_DN164_c0_g1_i1:96-1367(+)
MKSTVYAVFALSLSATVWTGVHGTVAVYRSSNDLTLEADDNIHFRASSLMFNGDNLALNTNSGSNCAAVKYAVCESKALFKQTDLLSGIGNHKWHSFSVDDTLYLLAANFRNADTFYVNSTMFEYSELRNKFEMKQSFMGRAATDWDTTVVDGITFAALAKGGRSEILNEKSALYRFNVSTRQFDLHQMLNTTVARDAHFYEIEGQHFVAFGADKEVIIFRYNETSTLWNRLASIKTDVEDIKTFVMHNQTYMLVVGQDSADAIFTFEADGSYTLFQNLSSTGERYDGVAFTINNVQYLGIARYEGSATAVNAIYKYDASTSQFFEWRGFEFDRTSDMEVFNVDGITYMAVANFGQEADTEQYIYRITPLGIEKVYTWSDAGRFDDMEYFEWQGERYLILGMFSDSSGNNVVNSILMRGTPCL